MVIGKKIQIISWVAWILGSSFFLTEYFVRVSVGVLSTTLFNEFNANATAIGLLSAYFYYSYITMQIPVGVLVDRFGARFLLSFATIIFGAACILFSHMSVLSQGYLARFIMGLVGAFAFVGTLKLITENFPANKFAILAGITQGGGMVGAIIGAAPMAYLFTKFGWRLSFASFGMIFIALGIIMYMVIRDNKSIIKPNNKSANNIFTDLKTVLSSRQTWFTCIFLGLMYGPTEVFGEEWGTMFCRAASKLSIEHAALQVSFIFAGMAIGCPLVGYISDHFKNRVTVMRITSVICFVLILLVIYPNVFNIHFGYNAVCGLLFIYGISNSAIIPAYAVATEVHSRHVSGIAIGVANMVTVLIGALLIPVVGNIMDILVNKSLFLHAIKNHNALHIIKHTASTYTLNDFAVAFSLLPICFVLCFVLTFFIKETHCVAVD